MISQSLESARPPWKNARSTAARPFRRLLKLDWRVRLPLLVLSLAILIAAFGPWVLPYSAYDQSAGAPLTGMTGRHPFGTDLFGRDQLSRVVEGARFSLLLSVVVTAISVALGLFFGAAIGYFAGRIDFVAGRILDVLFAFPGLLLALALAAILGPGVRTAGIALVVIYTPVATRFLRGVVAAERSRGYVVSARVSGASSARIIWKHILPNIWAHVAVISAMVMAFVILTEAALSYLGLGAQAPAPSWGRLLSDNSPYLTTNPELVVIPGIVVGVVVLALNLLSDGLRDGLDPTSKQLTSEM